jgi:hypothetical protein
MHDFKKKKEFADRIPRRGEEKRDQNWNSEITSGRESERALGIGIK